MKNLPLLLVTIVGSVGMIVAIALVFSRPSTTSQPAVDQALLIGDTPQSKGPENAKVTIVEFSDFQCPACQSAQATVQQLLASHPEDVRLVYRHYPLTSIHPYAQLAAQATEVAARENKFWEYHDLLFATQDDWSKMRTLQQVKEQFGDYAQQIGIDKATFLSTIDSDEVKSKVLEDVTLGGQLNIDSTPTFFVNGQPAAPGSGLVETVNELLQAS